MDVQKIKQTSILEVALKLDMNLKGQSGTKVTSCFAHEDKHPSLVFMPKVNRYECKSCGEKGDVIDLVQKVKKVVWKEAIKFIDPTIEFGPSGQQKKQTGEEYLKAHGVSKESIKKYNIAAYKSRIEIPTPGGIHTRLLNSSQKFIFKEGSTISLFKTGNLKKKVILVEGEIDSIVLNQNTGYPVWTSTGGCKTFKTEWKDDFKGIEKIYLGYDNDQRGFEGAEKAANMLGKERCYRVACPVKDWSDYFSLGYTKDDFIELIKAATQFKSSLPSLSERLTSSKPQERIMSGFNVLDSHVKGFSTGDLYVVGGNEKSGKSDFMLQITHNLLEDGKMVGYLNTELTDTKFFARLAARSNKVAKSVAEGDEAMLSKWVEENQGKFLYAGVSDLTDPKSNLRDFGKTMSLARSFVEQGAKVLFFDNLTTFNSQAKGRKSGWEELATATSAIINFTKAENVCTFVVIHTKPGLVLTETPSGIKKIIDRKEPERILNETVSIIRKPTSADLYGGGGALSQISGSLLIWRPFQKFNDSSWRELSQVVMDTFRDAPSGVGVDMLFDGATGLFTESLSPDKTPKEYYTSKAEQYQQEFPEKF
ncbi:bifunctional DNA primase/helicase [Patescibacteria group bacterium]